MKLKCSAKVIQIKEQGTVSGCWINRMGRLGMFVAEKLYPFIFD
jgi:hypothetical protein